MKGLVNRTLLFGEGLFETILWGCPEEKLRLHYERLSLGAKLLGLNCPSYESFLKALKGRARGKRLVLKYLLISYGQSSYFGTSNRTRVKVLTYQYKKKPNFVKLALSPYRVSSKDVTLKIKSTSRLLFTLSRREATRRGFYDALILNERGYITETTSANLILLKGSNLYTPSEDLGLLRGTTRKYLLKFFEVREERVRLKELSSFDGVFLINSLGISGVLEVEGIKLRGNAKVLEEMRETLKLW